MLFARAPFDDPLATNDKARRDATMQQILRGEWLAPPSVPVTPECLDLLRGILAADPTARISMAQIMAHPWFSVGLPPAALTMNTVLVRQQTAQPPPYEQTVEEVNAVLAEAQRKGSPGGPGGPGGPAGEMTDSGFMAMVRR
jgi:serine/threonine-protein kinase SRK2